MSGVVSPDLNKSVRAAAEPVVIPIPERMIRITDRIGNRPDISVRPIDMRNLERDAEYIRQIYNQAWSEQDISEREQEFKIGRASCREREGIAVVGVTDVQE